MSGTNSKKSTNQSENSAVNGTGSDFNTALVEGTGSGNFMHSGEDEVPPSIASKLRQFEQDLEMENPNQDLWEQYADRIRENKELEKEAEQAVLSAKLEQQEWKAEEI